MAYDKNKLEKEAIKAIEKNKLFFNADVVAYLPCSERTFYDLKLHESQSIKEALTKVKTDIKVSMRSKWYKSENATLQMGLMKLISTDEELRKLSMQHNTNEEFEKPIFKELDLDVTDNDSTD